MEGRGFVATVALIMNGHVIRRVLLSVILGFGLGLDIYGQVVGHMPENLPFMISATVATKPLSSN